MTNEHPITPPPELVQQWWEEADQDCDRDDPKNYFDYIATQAARWGADQELWTPNYLPPKPPMTDPIRSLCAELTEKLHEHTSLYDGHESELVARARIQLAQPEPEGLSEDGDVEAAAQRIYEAMRFERVETTPAWAERGNSFAQDAARKAARAVLNRHPTPQPEPEGLTDEELLKVFLDAKAADMARQGGLTSSDANGIARQLDAQTLTYAPSEND